MAALHYSICYNIFSIAKFDLDDCVQGGGFELGNADVEELAGYEMEARITEQRVWLVPDLQIVFVQKDPPTPYLVNS